MEKAKAAISDFVSHSGKKDTTVHEQVAPAVQHEVVKPHHHEEINTAVDRETHQDHYHRTVQPVNDREVLPEQHTAKMEAVQQREFDHRDHDSTKRTLESEQAQFRDEQRIDATSTSQSMAPSVGGEHVHHHIHETIQPVVQKETIQPNVTHTVVPIHEVHHNKAVHHDTTALPAMTMDNFKAKGGALGGREERYDEFEGAPKNVGGSDGRHVGTSQGLQHHTRDQAHHGGITTGNTGSEMTSGLAGVNTKQGMTATEQHHQSDRGVAGQGNMTGSSTQGGVVSSRPMHENNSTSNRVEAAHTPSAGSESNADVIDDTDVSHSKMKNVTADDDGTLPKALTEDRSKFVPHSEISSDSRSKDHNAHNPVHESGNKPSLGDKLNPKTDADGDGKAGMMD